MSFFISGVFWQDNMFPYIGYESTIGEMVMTTRAQVEAIFTGIVGKGIINTTSDGFLHDVYGNSELIEFEITDKAMQFTKIYSHRDDQILYDFILSEDGIWIGEWRGRRVGEGKAKCILTEIPTNFFTHHFKKK